MERTLQPEWLDTLPAHDPAAVGSRKDLRRLNALMRHGRILGAAIKPLLADKAPPRRIVEIGAGDGTLMLFLARKLAPTLGRVHVTLIDRVPVVNAATMKKIQRLGWSVELIEDDVWAWLNQDRQPSADLCLANLFLHHFEPETLARMTQHLARRFRAVVACEPRRQRVSLWAARLVGLIGCNRTTRHDAVVSVRAGFDRDELTQAWPNDPAWTLREAPSGLFSHLFVAKHSSL